MLSGRNLQDRNMFKYVCLVILILHPTWNQLPYELEVQSIFGPPTWLCSFCKNQCILTFYAFRWHPSPLSRIQLAGGQQTVTAPKVDEQTGCLNTLPPATSEVTKHPGLHRSKECFHSCTSASYVVVLFCDDVIYLPTAGAQQSRTGGEEGFL